MGSDIMVDIGGPAVALAALESALADGLRMSRRSLAGTIRRGTTHRLGGLAVDAAAAAIAAGRERPARAGHSACRTIAATAARLRGFGLQQRHAVGGVTG
ncbi:hypothetical protein [Actinophytocola sp.]|uniref:hypothetical protein n=1 Tax=Actinophytocola sp. TaxID=1872138 RepID=UPI002ED4D178